MENFILQVRIIISDKKNTIYVDRSITLKISMYNDVTKDAILVLVE